MAKSRTKIDIEAVENYKDFTQEDVSIIIEILSIFDNRHDFKEGARNKSLTIDEVLSLLKAKSEVIRAKILELSEERRAPLEELLDKHCENVKRHTLNSCKTTINPDKEVEFYMIQEIFKEPLLHDREAVTLKQLDASSNGKILRFEDKYALGRACGCEVTEDDKVKPDKRNLCLDKLLQTIANIMGTTPEKVRFCIDVSSIGEWVFRHDGLTNPPETHLKTIADEYDRFHTNPNTKKLPTAITLQKNHIMLEKFILYPDRITWSSPGNNNIQITLKGVDRAGVSIMAEAIRAVLDKDRSKVVKIIEDIFHLSSKLSPQEYGKHIMDFKRLMDMSKLAVTVLYNSLDLSKPVILVTHDHMLYLLAKMYKCPVILTLKGGDHSRSMLIDIPITLSPQQLRELKAKQAEEQKQLKLFWDNFPPITKLQYNKEELLQTPLPDIFKNLESKFIEYLLNLNRFFHTIQGKEIVLDNRINLLKDVTRYNETIDQLNTLYFNNIEQFNQKDNPLMVRINILLAILQPYSAKPTSTSYVPDTSILKKVMIMFENKFKELRDEFQKPARFTPAHQTQTGRVIPLKYNATGLQAEPITQTKFLEQFKKNYTVGGTSINTASIADYALDLLYKFIDKNIERYYSQPLHIQDQLMREAYTNEVGQSPTDTALIRFKKDREALFQRYIEADQAGPKAVSAPHVQPKQVTARVVSAPPVLPGQPYQTPMQVDARPKRSIRAVTNVPQGKKPRPPTPPEFLMAEP